MRDDLAVPESGRSCTDFVDAINAVHSARKRVLHVAIAHDGPRALAQNRFIEGRREVVKWSRLFDGSV